MTEKMVSQTNKNPCSGREILTAALTAVLKKPLFTTSAETPFSNSPSLHETPAPKAKPSRTANSQTDQFQPQPHPKSFRPQKTGIDSSSQVENSLVFDFDVEVAPLVNSLVSKILDQVTLEIHEETTLAKIRAFRRAAAERRDTEISVWESAIDAETQRQAVAEAAAAAVAAARAAEDLGRRREFLATFAVRYLASLVPSTVGVLRRDFGIFENEAMLEIERKFLPELIEKVQEDLARKRVGQAVADELLRRHV
jgi:hypothetical protein